MRPASPPAWMSLAASSSMCTLLIRQLRSSPSTQYSKLPPVASGSSYWLIWYALGRSG